MASASCSTPDVHMVLASAGAAGSPVAGEALHAPSSALRAAGLDVAVRRSSAAATAACLLVEMNPLAGVSSSLTCQHVVWYEGSRGVKIQRV